MRTIKEFSVIEDKKIKFKFDDGVEKVIDFSPFIGKDKLSSQLSDKEYFSKVMLYENGRGIYWPYQFDFCPDFLHSYHSSVVAM